MSSVPVTITSSGWTWSAYLLAMLNIIVSGGAVAAFIRTRPQTTKIKADREANLLHERAEEMASMRERLGGLERKLEQKDRLHEAERAVDRHRINNLSQCLDALLLLIEQDPDKAAQAATRIKNMRADQLKREATEKATIRAAGIALVDEPPQ